MAEEQGHSEGLQQFLKEQRVPDPFRSVEKLHEFLPDSKKVSGPSQHLQVTQWMAAIDGKEKHNSLNSRMEEKRRSTTQRSAKKSPNTQKQPFQSKKAATISEQGQRKFTSHKTIQSGIQNPEDSAGCHGKCVSDGQSHDGTTERG
ncbi:hypothetical protein O181_104278 [Austropuccinia psidii MF-1]|uniref:Uncharacterized protein n=1 Tax=Austropuccinia psidii MF-1 TaxID=1389203 RepID=A0A9Q3JJU3_9BASI|nr:hypothetical protein [Austropuccinia psidii MF-1]